VAALKTYALFIYRNIELRLTSGTFYEFDFALRWKRGQRLLFAGKKADRTWKRFVRPEAMPPVEESLDLHARGAGRVKMIHKDVEQSGVLHRTSSYCHDILALPAVLKGKSD
jgi:hypothetical protein